MNIQMTFFPSYGFTAFIMTGPIHWSDLNGLDRMVSQLQEKTNPGPEKILRCKFIIICSLDILLILAVESWWPSFKGYLDSKKNISWQEIEDNNHFQSLLSSFLFDVDNAKQQANIRFSSPLICGLPAPPIIVNYHRFIYYFLHV